MSDDRIKHYMDQIKIMEILNRVEDPLHKKRRIEIQALENKIEELEESWQ